MKVVVCDASPLIFLAKLDHLGLIRTILGKRVVVLECVVSEVRSERANRAERKRLDVFLDGTEIIAYETTDLGSSSLSRCDLSTLRWAVDQKANWLLADERLLRRIAAEEGLPVVGFLGLLTIAARMGILTAREARDSVDAAVTRHGCRISAALYYRILLELEEIARSARS